MSEDWICATWNVRSMVDTEGPIAVASCSRGRGEDRKVDQVVLELIAWRGITLLNVVGKLVARIVQRRLHVLAERELSEGKYASQKLAIQHFLEKKAVCSIEAETCFALLMRINVEKWAFCMTSAENGSFSPT